MVSSIRVPTIFLLVVTSLRTSNAFQLVRRAGLARINSPLRATNGDSTSSTVPSTVNVLSEEKDPDQWLRDSLEVEERCVIGPKEVLIYDTTLRGASFSTNLSVQLVVTISNPSCIICWLRCCCFDLLNLMHVLATTTAMILTSPFEIFTQKDGTQGEAVAATCDDKLKIVRRLHQFDTDFVEAGWPGSNPKDAEFFERAKTELTVDERSKLVAFGSTRRKSVRAAEDPQVKALLDSEAPTVCLVAKAAAWQVEEILKATREENLEMIRDTVSHLCSEGRRVFVDLEHFFDGYSQDADYALKCAEVAAEAGASCLVLCDTNGGSMPWEVSEVSKTVVDFFGGMKTIGK